ncbi:MAG: NBR1-Ig-like domain-containing protein [Chloroflexota bacterium]
MTGFGSKQNGVLKVVLFIILMSSSLASCRGDKLPLTSDMFLPPTSWLTETALPLPTATHPPATPTLACTDNLRFLTDLTIPDGMAVEPGAPLDKRWQVQNTGTCNWDDRYRLRLIAGVPMGAPEEQTLPPARSGTETIIRILYTAPTKAGSYRSAWQAYNPEGEPFGDPIFIEIVVEITEEG